MFCQFPARSPWGCRQNPESGFRTLETPKLQAERVGARTADAAGFSSPREGVFFLPRVPKRDLPKAGASRWLLLPTHDEAQVAQLLAGSVKFRPSRHLRPPVIPATAACPAPPLGSRARTRLINFLNPSPSLPPRVVGLEKEQATGKGGVFRLRGPSPHRGPGEGTGTRESRAPRAWPQLRDSEVGWKSWHKAETLQGTLTFRSGISCGSSPQHPWVCLKP